MSSTSSSLCSIVIIYAWVMHMSTGFPFNFTTNSLSPSCQSFSHSWMFFCLSLLLFLPDFHLLPSELFRNRHFYSHPLQSILSHLFPEHLFLSEPYQALCTPISHFVARSWYSNMIFLDETSFCRLLQGFRWMSTENTLHHFLPSTTFGPWLMALFMLLSFDTIAQSMTCLRKNIAR